jgi:hypothetical protein
MNSGNALQWSPTVVNENFTVNLGEVYWWQMVKARVWSELAYGNYINNGATDFEKDRCNCRKLYSSPANSELQKQGNVIVGGQAIGKFNTTGVVDFEVVRYVAVIPMLQYTSSVDGTVPGVFQPMKVKF